MSWKQWVDYAARRRAMASGSPTSTSSSELGDPLAADPSGATTHESPTAVASGEAPVGAVDPQAVQDLSADIPPPQADMELSHYLPPAVRVGRPRLGIQYAAELLGPNALATPRVNPQDAAVPALDATAAQPPVARLLAPTEFEPSQGMVPKVASYMPKHVAGFALAPVTSQALLHCTSCAQQAAKEDVDGDYHKLDSYHLTSGIGYHLVSNAAQSLVTGVDVSLLSPKLCRLSSAQWTFNRLLRTTLEAQLSSPQHAASAIAYCEALSWDETPLKVSVARGSGQALAAEALAVCGSTDNGDIKVLDRLSSGLRPDALVCKVLQTQQWCGMLVKVGELFLKVLFQQVCPLQILAIKQCCDLARSAAPTIWLLATKLALPVQRWHWLVRPRSLQQQSVHLSFFFEINDQLHATPLRGPRRVQDVCLHL